jgi:hypothetical protein
MWLSSLAEAHAEGRGPASAILLTLLLASFVVFASLNRRWQELLTRAGVALIFAPLVVLSPLLLGAAIRVQTESVIAGVFGASVRFLMPHRQPLRTVFAGYLGSVALAQWGVPALLHWQGWPSDSAPLLGFVGGLAGLEVCRLTIEVAPDWLRKKFGKDETS